MQFRIAVACAVAASVVAVSTGAGSPPPAAADSARAATEPMDAPALSSILDSLSASPNLDRALLERAVLARNPSLAAMRAAWRQTEAQADRAGALDDPVLEVMLAPGSFGKEALDPAYALGLSQRLPIFGQRGLRRRAASAMARSAEEVFRTLGQDLIHETRRLYYELYVVARGVELNRELIDLLAQFRRVALQKYAAGTVGQQDALQAEVELSMLDHQRLVLERTRRVTTAQLRALLHDDSERPLPDPPRALPDRGIPADSSSAAARAMNLRPELLMRDATRDVREAELRLARRARLPDLTLQARYDRFWEIPELRTAVGLELNIPIGWGRIDGDIRAAQAGLDRAELERLAERDRVRAELKSALARVEDTMHEVHIMESGVVPVSERALASMRAGYEANRSDFLTLLNAERDLARARFDLHRAEADYGLAVADLERAIGSASAPFGEEEGR